MATLVSVLEAHIEPLGSDVFDPLRGGYVRLTGRIGRIFSLVNREVNWMSDYWPYNMDNGPV